MIGQLWIRVATGVMVFLGQRVDMETQVIIIATLGDITLVTVIPKTA